MEVLHLELETCCHLYPLFKKEKSHYSVLISQTFAKHPQRNQNDFGDKCNASVEPKWLIHEAKTNICNLCSIKVFWSVFTSALSDEWIYWWNPACLVSVNLEPDRLKLLFFRLKASEGAACNYRPHDLNDKGLVFHPFLPALTLFSFNGTTITINI